MPAGHRPPLLGIALFIGLWALVAARSEGLPGPLSTWYAALELFAEVGELDLLVVPVGGGGLASGSALSLAARAPRCKLLLAEPADAEGAVARSRFYLMPIRSMSDPFEGVKFLRVASIDPGSGTAGKSGADGSGDGSGGDAD